MRFTLITDGSSDSSLQYVIHWLIRQYLPKVPIDGEWADLARLPNPPASLSEKVIWGCQLYPCELLFIHRDSEKESRKKRVEEIEAAVAEAQQTLGGQMPMHVCIIPVHMLEAWFLFDEQHIRQAASNPNGRMSLILPAIGRVESMPDPKKVLLDLLSVASGLKGRKLKRFRPQPAVHRLAECINDFSPLRQLPAFREFETEVEQALRHF